MSFSALERAYLQRLVAMKPLSRRAGPIGLFFRDQYGLGLHLGSFIHYEAKHIEQAAQLLRIHDLPVDALGPNAKRSDAAQYGGMSEKSGTRAPHAGEVAYKVLGDCTFAGKPIHAPPGSCMVGKVELLLAIECDVLCWVENWESFMDLHQYTWLDTEALRVLFIFRGDSLYSTVEARRLLSLRSEPIWAFVDFDPAGLGVASTLPAGRLRRLVLPDLQVLLRAADTSHGRELYDVQVKQWGRQLDGAPSAVVLDAWRVMKDRKCGVTQGKRPAIPPWLGIGVGCR